MSAASETSSIPPMQMASSNDGNSVPRSSMQQQGGPLLGRNGLLEEMYATDRSRSSVTPQGAPINSKLMTRRDPHRQSTIASGTAPGNGVVMEVSKAPQDVVVDQLTAREWETSELAGPRENFPTDSAALNAQVTGADRPRRSPRASAVQRGSSRPAKVSAARTASRTRAAAAAPPAPLEEENLAPGQRPKRASLYHDVGPVPRTPRGAQSDTDSNAAARRARSASASKYKNVRSVVRDYMDNRITEDEARYSALRAQSPSHVAAQRESATPKAITSANRAASPGDVEVSPDSAAEATPTPSQRTPRGPTAAQRRSLLPPDQRSTTPRSQAKVSRDFVPRCATMIPERLKYHPKPIVATEECDPTTVDGIPYDVYCEQQEAAQAARDAKLRRGNESGVFDAQAQSQTQSRGQSQGHSRATSAQRSRQSRGRSRSATSRRANRADPLQVGDDEFVVPVTVDSEALSREDPYAPPKRSVSKRRTSSRSPRAESRRASRAQTPRGQRGRSPRDSALAGSRTSQLSTQGVNPYAYRRKLVFPVAPPDFSQSGAVVPAN